MDAKITLSFDETIIKKAKKFAEENNTSVSRLTEFLLRKVTSSNYSSFEDFPISDWVYEVSEGESEYKVNSKRSRKDAKEEFFKSKK